MRAIVQLLLLLVGCGLAFGQDVAPLPLNPDPLAEDVAAYSPFLDDDFAEDIETSEAAPRQDSRMLVSRDQTRVAILGYHNFSKTAPVTDMLMRTSDFRKQMEYIRDAGLTVISMPEFLEWRFGSRELPARCVLITLDDGWKSVYTEAYPILHEFGYPFHLFLYTQFLSGRGDSMSPEMIREMQQNGATIGSHSTSHAYPRFWKAAAAKGPEAVAAMIDKEIGATFPKLSGLFGPIDTYCYPGGYHTPAMEERLPGSGCKAAFTVIPGKVTVSENPMQIRRYMIFGNNHSIFRRAMDFRIAQLSTAAATGATPGTLPSSTPPPPFPVYPGVNATVPCEFGSISIDMSRMAGVDFSTVHMAVSGFGRVPARVDRNTRAVQWTPPVRIYMPNISVHVTWKSTDGTAHKAEWSFCIDPYATVQQ